MVCILSIVLGPSGRITHVIRYIAYIGLFGTGKCRFIQVLYLGRAPRTKETLPDFREKCRVTRHSRVFRELTGSQRTPGFWGVTNCLGSLCLSSTTIIGLSPSRRVSSMMLDFLVLSCLCQFCVLWLERGILYYNCPF